MRTTLTEIRRASGFSTQESLAVSIGIGRPAVCKWELGQRYPRTLMLAKLAKVLNTTEGEIIAAITSAKNKMR